jgi:hypothetical protein
LRIQQRRVFNGKKLPNCVQQLQIVSGGLFFTRRLVSACKYNERVKGGKQTKTETRVRFSSLSLAHLRTMQSREDFYAFCLLPGAICSGIKIAHSAVIIFSVARFV